MTNASRANILRRLRQVKPESIAAELAITETTTNPMDQHTRLSQLKVRMSAVQTEIHTCTSDTLEECLWEVITHKKIKTILFEKEGFETIEDRLLIRAGQTKVGQAFRYNRPIETFKRELFNQIEAGITRTEGAIVDTGALILVPDVNTPRLMSLVPPIHIAVLQADALFSTFQEYLQQRKTSAMPSNLLLISGPSKTADIQQTLAYGAHGPKELIVVIVEKVQ